MVDLTVVELDGRTVSLLFKPTTLVIAGWTGRDEAAVQAHIRELEELGVAPPKTVPIYYRVSTDRLTTAPTVQMVGRDGSGEVEAVLWKHDGEWLVGIGSDHTDRKIEAIGITVSKQLCAKPVSPRVWRWKDVAGHWDRLTLRSTLPRTGEVYQAGGAASLRRPDELLALYEARNGALPNGAVMFCGTLAVTGGIRFAEEMAIELHDPALDRRLSHSYVVDVLPIVEE